MFPFYRKFWCSSLILYVCLGLTHASAKSDHGAAPPRRGKAQAIYSPRPEYPFEARRQKMTGRGIFVLEIEQNTGSVLAVKIAQTTGHRMLDNAAIDALKKWRFRPGTFKKVRIPMAFTIGKRPY